jgi:hypothetical protein
LTSFWDTVINDFIFLTAAGLQLLHIFPYGSDGGVMMRLCAKVLVLVMVVILGACAFPPSKDYNTPSGRPEVIFTGLTIAQVKDKIIQAQAGKYDKILKNSGNSLSFLYKWSKNKKIYLSIASLGTAPTEFVHTYDFIQQGPKVVRVIFSMSMGGGIVPVNSSDDFDNAMAFNESMKFLIGLGGVPAVK